MSGANAFAVSTEVISGLGSIAEIENVVHRLGGTRVAVVVDAGVEQAGLLTRVLGQAGSVDPAVVVLVEPDPDISTVEEAVTRATAAGVDLVLAIGGGSALGVGKAVGIRLTNPLRIDAYEGSGRVVVQPAPVIAVPTTAGSGSEVSNALVLHEAGRSQEIVVRGAGCEPRVAILDGSILRTLPGKPMLYAAFDALTHSLEALWAKGATSFTDALALHAAHSIIKLLPAAIDGIDSGLNASGENDDILQGMLEASSAANMACGNSGLALVHALTTSPDVKVPHGLQNAVLLPHIAEFNRDHLSPAALELLPLVHNLFDRLGFTASFPSIGHHEIDGTSMIYASTDHPFRINNRRAATDDDLRQILALAGALTEGARP